MMKNILDIEYTIRSNEKGKDLFVELSSNNSQWGEIKLVKPDNNMVIILYLVGGKVDIEVDYKEFMKILKEAGDKLFKIEGNYSSS